MEIKRTDDNDYAADLSSLLFQRVLSKTAEAKVFKWQSKLVSCVFVVSHLNFDSFCLCLHFLVTLQAVVPFSFLVCFFFPS